MANTPHSIGIIIDGNRRWAKARGLPSFEGHRIGLKNVKTLAIATDELGIKELTIYAFSTENWNRTEEEVGYLMRLFRATIENEIRELMEKGVRVRFIGQRDRVPPILRKLMQSAEEESRANSGMLFQIALSYGGRAEILDAVNHLLITGAKSVDEAGFRKAMWSAGMTDPDLIIRTGGDRRLSNFLLFQAAYSELFFTDTKWPDFSREELESIIAEFSNRERRHGK